MAVTTSDFYADLQASRGEYIVKDYSEQVAQRGRDQRLAKADDCKDSDEDEDKDKDDEMLEKNAGAHGEGSRGGKIIGHTKSGKPIYSSSSPMNLRGGKHVYSKVLASHAPLGYSIHDHAEAAKVHQDNFARTGGMRHHDASIYHAGASAAKLRGEGSTFDERHGKTSTNIGWTSSKKPIFGHDHEANTARSGVLGGHVKHGYGAIEHNEASAAHIKAAAKVGRRDGKVATRHLKLAAAHADAAKIYDDPTSPRGPSGLPKI